MPIVWPSVWPTDIFEKRLRRCSTHFFNWVFLFLVESSAVCVFWRLIPFILIVYKYSLLLCKLSFHFVCGLLSCAKFGLVRSHLCIIAFKFFHLWAKNVLLWVMYENVLPMVFSRSWRVSCPIFRSLKRLGLIFVYDVRMLPRCC